jgi:hypothetical protein
VLDTTGAAMQATLNAVSGEDSSVTGASRKACRKKFVFVSKFTP